MSLPDLRKRDLVDLTRPLLFRVPNVSSNERKVYNMIKYMLIGTLVEIIRMSERYLRKKWTFEDYKTNPWMTWLTIGNFILTTFLWPISIVGEIVECVVERKGS